MRPTHLDPRKPYKPLDIGNGIVSGILTTGGRWLSLGVEHPVHGRVVLTDVADLPEERRLDQPAVRAYRAELASASRAGFGLALLSGGADAFLVEDSLPLAVHDRADARIEVLSFAPAGRRGAVQIVRVAAREEAIGLAFEWTGEMRLRRASYTQLTPGGALPPTRSRPLIGRDSRLIWIDDRELGAAAAIAIPADAQIPAGMSLPFVVAVSVADTLADAAREATSLAGEGVELVEAEVLSRRRWWQAVGRDGDADRPIRRAAAYALDCAASRAGEGVVAVLADHVILPLIWTRDAYFVCRMLLALDAHDERVRVVVDGFLRWTFEVAERPQGWWPRASLANGMAKDPVFQLDQQLFPLLLLADHARITGDASILARYRSASDDTIAALLARRSPFGLIAADETPADDPSEQPYHFSSHVLLWRVLRDVDAAVAADVRASVLEHFVADGRFAYAVAGARGAGARGAGARHYHDANDMPTVFAPGWGFCAATDPVWRATIEFAWSDRNEAHFPGPLGGLGSLHTPHPWPFGDLQDVIVARAIDDGAREQRAWDRLRRVETHDGLLPEAYDERDARVVSRHWFAWPAALRALLALEPMLTAP